MAILAYVGGCNLMTCLFSCVKFRNINATLKVFRHNTFRNNKTGKKAASFVMNIWIYSGTLKRLVMVCLVVVLCPIHRFISITAPLHKPILLMKSLWQCEIWGPFLFSSYLFWFSAIRSVPVYKCVYAG